MTDGERQGAPPQRSASRGFFNRPTVIVLFYLATYFTVFSAVVGVVLAYIWKGEEQDAWETSHFPYLIRTFWISLMTFPMGLIALICVFSGIGSDGPGMAAQAAAIIFGLAFLAINIMAFVRCIYALVCAQKQQPIPRPRSWLV